MKKPRAQTNTKNIKDDQSIVGRVHVEPGGMASIKLGRYKKTDPAPAFSVEYKPDDSTYSVTFHDVDLMHDDHVAYDLVRKFQNFGYIECEVVIRHSAEP